MTIQQWDTLPQRSVHLDRNRLTASGSTYGRAI